jgi:lysozyme
MKTLKKGAKGNEVKSLQQALKNLGYVIGVDGSFGNETEKVVMQFQRDHNLAVDGVAGSNTMAVINDLQNGHDGSVGGIDISHHNGVINWNIVPQGQVSFVFCKATQGKQYRDEMMVTNMNELKRLGFIRGVYHFLTFKDVTATEQVNNLMSCGIDFTQPGTLPPVLDVEWQQSESLNQYIKDNRVACVKKVKDWLVGIENATGRKPILYTNSNFWKDYLGNPGGFETYPLWIASYRNDNPMLASGWNDYAFWQFTASGFVTGITGNVDKNTFKAGMKALKKMALL